MNIKIKASIVDLGTREQIDTLSDCEVFKNQKIRVMPDCHKGMGVPIGFTSTTGDKVIPNVIGVDIGCGMLTVNLGCFSKDKVSYSKLDKIIKKNIPSGFSSRGDNDWYLQYFDRLNDLKIQFQEQDINKFISSLGTLGGGNHFIEINKEGDKHEGNHYLVIHTGSRSLGKKICDHYQKIASENHPHLPKELSYLEGKEAEYYLNDMAIAQEYASENRKRIANIILEHWNTSGKKRSISDFEYFETVHNYINFKDNIVRKGAVSAHDEEILLIPLNMRDGSLICKGKGNEDWNYSAPHGAGRVLSRTQAKKQLKMEDYIESMIGIYSTSVNKKTLDEAPFAYKDGDVIIKDMEDTAEVIKRIIPTYNFKASN